jgi:hypothetical protein
MSEHDVIAYQLFDTAFKNKIAVGQLRTRLGIAGCERSGPLAAAKALLSHLNLSGA